MAHISVNTNSCIGAGQCVLTAPEIFDQDEQGIVTLINAQPDASATSAMRLASRICPSQSITVHED